MIRFNTRNVVLFAGIPSVVSLMVAASVATVKPTPVPARMPGSMPSVSPIDPGSPSIFSYPPDTAKPTPAATATAVAARPDPTKPQPPKVASPTHTSRPKPPPPSPTEVYYKNCDEVRAAGKAPLYRGQPGYRPGLDRDGDGVACE